MELVLKLDELTQRVTYLQMVAHTAADELILQGITRFWMSGEAGELIIRSGEGYSRSFSLPNRIAKDGDDNEDSESS